MSQDELEAAPDDVLFVSDCLARSSFDEAESGGLSDLVELFESSPTSSTAYLLSEKLRKTPSEQWVWYSAVLAAKLATSLRDPQSRTPVWRSRCSFERRERTVLLSSRGTLLPASCRGCQSSTVRECSKARRSHGSCWRCSYYTLSCCPRRCSFRCSRPSYKRRAINRYSSFSLSRISDWPRKYIRRLWLRQRNSSHHESLSVLMEGWLYRGTTHIQNHSSLEPE